MNSSPQVSVPTVRSTCRSGRSGSTHALTCSPGIQPAFEIQVTLVIGLGHDEPEQTEQESEQHSHHPEAPQRTLHDAPFLTDHR